MRWLLLADAAARAADQRNVALIASIGIVALAAAGVAFRIMRHRGRRVAAVAATMSGEFHGSDPAQIGQIHFPAFAGPAGGRKQAAVKVTNVITVELVDEVTIRVFDFDVKLEDRVTGAAARARAKQAVAGQIARSNGRRRASRGTRTGAYVCLDAALPTAMLGRRLKPKRAIGTQVASRREGAPLDAYCTDPRFATLFANANIVEFLIGHPELVLETSGPYLFVHRSAVKPSEFVSLARSIAALAQMVGSEVYRHYPPLGAGRARPDMAQHFGDLQ